MFQYNKRSTIIILGFCFLTILIVIYSNKVRVIQRDYNLSFARKKVPKYSQFSKIHLFQLENNKPVLNLASEFLDIIDNKKMTFILPKGDAYNLEGDKISFSSQEGSFSFKSQNLKLVDDVEFKESLLDMKTGLLSFYLDSGKLAARKGVDLKLSVKKTKDKILINSNELNGNVKKQVFEYLGNVSGQLKRSRRYEPGFNFKGNSLMVDLPSSLVSVKGDVEFKRNSFNALAGKADIFLENYNKRLKYYVLYDDIRLQEQFRTRKGTKVSRKAYADKMEGHSLEGKIVMTGTPRVVQGTDVIKGYKVILREETELVEVEDSSSSFMIKKK